MKGQISIISSADVVFQKVFLTLHLHQELCLDPPSRFALVLISGSTEGVHLVYEDDGRLVLASQIEQILHQSGKQFKSNRSVRPAAHAHCQSAT